ncbi:MAG: endoribonuclease MazF [Bacteroidetes bacterium]|nr:endoribonuclease MazF [Bacteroidota bacterium]
MTPPYCPRRGDVIWISFDPQDGHEQSGMRPALVLSPQAYNRKVGLALMCPLTSEVKGYPFEVALPDGIEARGVILADQVKSLDWRARRSAHFCTVPDETVLQVLGKLGTLLGE